MPTRGYPDFTQVVTHIITGGLAGLEELAARLKSIAPWDMRGNIVLMEDFESEETEWHDNSGDGCSAVRRSTHKFSGDWSLKLLHSGEDGVEADIYRYIHYPGLNKYALFARLAWTLCLGEVALYWDLWSGTTKYEITVYYDCANRTLKVLTTDDAYHEVDIALTLRSDKYLWYPVLVTFDLSTRKYDKLYFADREYDISDVALNFVTVGGGPGTALGATLSSCRKAGECAVYVDDIVIAKNVP